jgi:uncharacterized protein YjdB
MFNNFTELRHFKRFEAMHPLRSAISISLITAVLVTPNRLASQQVAEVQIAPVTVTMAVGERKELLASAYDSRGDNLATTTFLWTSSNPGVVRVEEDPSMPGIAVLIGVAPGLANVEARTGNRSASAAVQVMGAGVVGQVGGTGAATVLQIDPGSVFLLPSEDVRLQARFLKDDGSLAAPMAVTWRTLRPDVADITPDGSVIGVSVGQGVLEASTTSGLLARVTVQVAQAPFGFRSEILAVSPGRSDTVEVVVPSQNHRSISSRRLIWRSTNDAVARVSPIGVVTGVAGGEAEIVATGFGQEGRLAVTVHREVELLDVSPAPSAGPVHVPLGGSISFTATARAADETPVPEAPLVWVQTDTAIAVFDPGTGAMTGRALGETELKVRAPGEGLEATWRIAVIAGGLLIEPGAMTLGRADEGSLEAFFTDDSGIPVSEATALTWTSDEPGVVSVAEGGNLRGAGFGTAQVAATTAWGVADTATVYVQGEILVTSTRGGRADVYAFDRDSPAEFNQVTNETGNELNAVFSPDGTRIVYVSDQGGNLDLFVMNADGTESQQITATVSLEGSPGWTSDGRQIVYESDVSGTVQIWIVNADGSDPRQLTRADAPSMQPAVSPDGSTIAFTSARQGGYDIFLMEPDGSNQRNFTALEGNETMAAWVGDSAVSYIADTGERRSRRRVVARMNFSREVTELTPAELAVTDYAISRSGDLVAAIVSAEGPQGLESRMYLFPLTGGIPVEVPREVPTDQWGAPSFRR